jgi:anthranilate 1,2-dioxygenase small subunit
MDSQALYHQISVLLSRYVHTIDGDELEAWPDLFTEQCVYRVISRENHARGLPVAAMYCDSRAMLIDRVVSLRHANIYEQQSYRHVVSALLVDDNEDGSYSARSNYVVYRTRTNGVTEVYNTGVYEDRIVTDNEGWRFAEKHVIFDTGRIDTLMVIPI